MSLNRTFTSCIICSSNRLKPMLRYQSAYLVKCQQCNFVFSQKIPSEKELMDHYEGYGRNDYLSPITIKRYHELLDTFEKYRKCNRILDVGCGIGYFLVEAKKRGWEVHGTEYNEKAVDICRKKGIDMQIGILDTKNYVPASFDIITSFEVIEHINNPVEEIPKFNQLLRNNGLVYITTPNFNSVTRDYLRNKWDVIVYPEHLSYYTSRTIQYLMKKSGFEKLKIQTTGISITRIKVGKNMTDHNPISSNSDDEKIRQMAESKWYVRIAKSLINRCLTLFKKGDTIKGYFIKSN